MWPSWSAWTAPKLLSACSRASTRSGCVVVTVVGRGAAGAAPLHWQFLEVELVDVLDRERVRRSENDLRTAVGPLDDRVLAELARLELLADGAGDRALGERRDRVAREVPEI